AHGLRRLEQAAERLEKDEIDARLEEDPRLLLEDLADLRELQRPVRLDERAERTDRARDERELARGGLAREANALAVDLLERVRPLVRGELDAIRVPGVRRQDARA